MFPGQEYDRSSSIVVFSMVCIFFPGFSRIAVDETLDEHGVVFFPLAERRNLDGEYVGPIKQVAAVKTTNCVS